ncbi:MAG: hypothetical protein J0H17_11695 [Rhizobiales bacterium]|jgi:hypothetical protein|nr:hypothetical protein [Hyphomicrobiales bacterium]
MRTVNAYLEKAAAFEQLAAHAANDLIRKSYLDLAKGYRDLAENRRLHLHELAAAIVKAQADSSVSPAAAKQKSSVGN